MKIDREKLHKKYEKILQTDFAIGDGWLQLIDYLLFALLWDIEHNNENPNLKITCIKEKFGTLRVYANASEKQAGMISMAELLSEAFCEECGSNKNVKLTDGAWKKTLCEVCLKKEPNKN